MKKIYNYFVNNKEEIIKKIKFIFKIIIKIFIAITLIFKFIVNLLKSRYIRLDILFVIVMLLYMIFTMGSKAEATIEASERYHNISFNVEVPTEYNWNIPIDLDRLAYAVRRHETANCTLGYGAMYNNCYGIKNGNTAPCEKIGNNRMCIYKTQADSTKAFKIIWTKVYGGKMPTITDAKKWSGNHNAENWLYNVTTFYNDNI